MAGRRRRRRTAEEEKSWAAAEAEDFAQASAAAPGFILCYPPPADSPDACRLSALYAALLADSSLLRYGDGEGGSSDSDLDVGPDPLGDMRAAAAAAAAAGFAPGDSDSDDARPAKGHGGPVLGAGAGSGGGGGAGDVVDRAAAWAVRWIGPLLAVGCLFPPLLLALRLLFGRRARRGRRGGAAGDDWVGHEAAAWAGVCGRILLWFQVRARAQCTRALHTHARPALPTNESLRQLPVLLVLLASIGAAASIEHAVKAQLRAGRGVPLSPPARAESTFPGGGGDRASSGGTQSWCGRKETDGRSGS
jgi:hypothetical protein